MPSFKITCYNIQGMFSSAFGEKMTNPDFVNTVYSSDIIILLETWSRLDSKTLTPLNYRELRIPSIKMRNVKNGRDSGGIIVWFKDHLWHYIQPVKKGKTHIWIKLKRELLCLDEDLYLCATYIPPYESPYYNDDIFSTLQSEIIYFQSLGSVLLMGDLNARTGKEVDYISSDGDKYINGSLIHQQKRHTKTRQNYDNTINRHGKQVLQLCKSLGLYIVNGRTKGDSLGRFTYCSHLGSSTVDYGITDIDQNKINYFTVMPQLPLSDHSHTVLSLNRSVNLLPSSDQKVKLYPLPPKFIWSKDSPAQYEAALQSTHVQNMIDSFLLTSFSEEKTTTNLATEQLTKIFSTVVRKALRKRENYRSKKEMANAGWFDKECQKVRKELRSLSNKKHRDPANQQIRATYQETLKMYKSLLIQKKTDHMKIKLNKIEEAVDQNCFWELWNNLDKSKKSKHLPIYDPKIWTEHFGNLYSPNQPTLNQKHLTSQLHNLECTIKDQLNHLDQPIALNELTHKMKSLKNKKSCGVDGISNEMLKHSSPKLKDAILKLFNLLLKSGKFPEIWKENLITPIFKQGEKYDPNNYRGITVSSNLGKLFCSIINDRLVQFTQEHKILKNCQIGFMPNQRTSNHIYTLHTLIQKYVHQKKQGKIFGCFIDFKKAFDSLWHDGLFLKLIQSGIGGRTYDIIKDIYNGNKCCVKINDKRTDYFSQNKGVRQGCSLSPTLFNIYINELASALEKSSCPGLTLEGREIKCLLYADDLLLLSPHEEGLHESLSVLEQYSSDWALPINMAKSKIMIFQKKPRLTDKKYNFTIGGTLLNHVTHYNYLGLTISASGLFEMAMKDLTDKARRAYYNIRKSLFKFNPPIKLWMKIFDGIIKPILLYGCEIWGPKFKLNYESWDKNPVEIFHLEFCKNILGLHRNAPSLGCRAELGRFPLLSEIQKRAAKFWFHLSDSQADAYHHCALAYRAGHPETDPLHYLVETHQLNSKIQFKLSKIKEIGQRTQEKYTHDWQIKTAQINKLKYFHKIKSDYQLAPYLIKIKDYRQRKLLAKYRLSDHSLYIETGRHKQSWTARELRLCSNCSEGVVEDELHFLTQCSKYNNIREMYFTQIGQILPEFQQASHIDKLCYILGEKEKCVHLAAEYVSSCHIMRDKE